MPLLNSPYNTPNANGANVNGANVNGANINGANTNGANTNTSTTNTSAAQQQPIQQHTPTGPTEAQWQGIEVLRGYLRISGQALDATAAAFALHMSEGDFNAAWERNRILMESFTR